MQENAPKTFEGYFKIECIKDGKVIDSFEDHNAIMHSARRSMAEIFLNRANDDKQFANRFVLGTEGGTSTEYIPKTEAMGFSKDKPSQRIYAEDGFIQVVEGSRTLNKFCVIQYKDKWYRYLGETESVAINDDTVRNTDIFVNVSKPYWYEITFDYSDKTKYVIGMDSNNVATGNSLLNRCSVTVSLPTDGKTDILEQSICQFVFYIPKGEANGQHTPSDTGYSSNISLFTEAGLYVNGRLFSMKTFPAKVKDDTTEVQITWRIIF